jgi:hypothetical protein
MPMVAQAGLNASRLLEQAGIKATERDAAERLQRLILEELHHRVKNTLATVIAIASQSVRNAVDLEHGAKSISDRLIALGRAHDLLLRSNWLSAHLPEIVRASNETIDHKRFVVLGADIEVGPTAVLTLAMALNELCTNAVTDLVDVVTPVIYDNIHNNIVIQAELADLALYQEAKESLTEGVEGSAGMSRYT